VWVRLFFFWVLCHFTGVLDEFEVDISVHIGLFCIYSGLFGVYIGLLCVYSGL